MVLVKVKQYLRKRQRPGIVVSLSQLSCVGRMTAKNHFNEIKKQKQTKKPQKETAGVNNHVETISRVVKSYKIGNTFFKVLL